MRYLKIAFGLAVVVGLMAVVASPALAATPKWVTCEKVEKGQWLDSLCTKAGAGTWETKAISETLEVTSSGTLELEDSAATGGAVIIECEGSNLGTIGAEGGGGISRISASKCKFIAGKNGTCETGKAPTARALNLPWAARLEERENTETKKLELRSLIRSLTTNPPGWAVECEVGGVIKVTDECTGGTSTSVVSNRATGKTEFAFDAVSAQEPAKCSLGNATSGSVRGGVIGSLRNKKGELLPLWVLASVLST